MEHETLRTQTLEANLAVWKAGLIVLTWGNASVADREAGVFAIKPSGVRYEELTASSMVVVAISDGSVVAGNSRPSSDTPTHQRIYAAFESVGSVVHTHSEAATGFAQACLPIPCMGTTHADHFAGTIPVVRHPTSEELAGDYETATGDIVVSHFKQYGIDPLAVPAVLLPHHGPFAWGATGEKAVANAIALESVARMAASTRAVASQPPEIPTAMLEKHFQRKHGPAAYYGQPK